MCAVAIETALVCVCNKCGHKWVPENWQHKNLINATKLPRQCPKRDCRSIQWNGAKPRGNPDWIKK